MSVMTLMDVADMTPFLISSNFKNKNFLQDRIKNYYCLDVAPQEVQQQPIVQPAPGITILSRK